MPKRLKGAAVAALLALLPLGGCAVQVRERDLLRPVASGPVSAAAVAAAAPDYAVEEGFVTAPDGTRLYAVLLRHKRARGAILYFGGNQFTVGRFAPAAARVFAPLEVNLMLVDHRGYGQSGGTPSSAALMTDGLAAFDHLARRPGIDPKRILVHGQSLGSFVAGHLAARRDTAGAVLESSVTTTEEWAKANSAALPVKVRIARELSGQGNAANVPRIAEPLLILVGGRDKVTPPALSEKLYAASPLPPGRKVLKVVEGAGHNDVLAHPEAISAYRAFLANALD